MSARTISLKWTWLTKAGLPQAQISRIERGVGRTSATLAKIAEAFGVELRLVERPQPSARHRIGMPVEKRFVRDSTRTRLPFVRVSSKMSSRVDILRSPPVTLFIQVRLTR